jgi:outer membrane protein assembly factor BamB
MGPGKRFAATVLAAALSIAANAAAPANAAAAAHARAGWPQFQGDAGHSGWDRAESILKPSNIGDLDLVWSAFSESFVPVVAGGVVYTIPNDPTRMEALDDATGAVLWRSDPQTSGTAAVMGSILYLTQFNGLLALRASNGKKLWFSPTDQELDMPPVISAGRVYEISSGLTTMYAFDATTGALSWSLPLDSVSGIPAAMGDRVFVEEGTQMIAFDAADGHVVWTAKHLRPSAAMMTVATPGAVLGVRGGAVYAFDPATGARLWRSRSDGYTAVAATRDAVYASNGTKGTFGAFDIATGEMRWSRRVAGAPFLRPPVVGGGMVVSVADDGTIVALRTTTGAPIGVNVSVDDYGALAMAHGTLYVQSNDGLSVFRLPAG